MERERRRRRGDDGPPRRIILKVVVRVIVVTAAVLAIAFGIIASRRFSKDYRQPIPLDTASIEWPTAPTTTSTTTSSPSLPPASSPSLPSSSLPPPPLQIKQKPIELGLSGHPRIELRRPKKRKKGVGTSTPIAVSSPVSEAAKDAAASTTETASKIASTETLLGGLNPSQETGTMVQTQGTENGAPCYVANFLSLKAAVADSSCGVITLANSKDDAYLFTEEIRISRPLTIHGNPQSLPTLNCTSAVRCFHVSAGGGLSLDNTRTVRGMGVLGPGGIRTIKGGTIYVDIGASLITFQGVVFTGLYDTPEAVQGAMTATANGWGTRVFGGHVMVVSGAVALTGCIFWGTTLFLPITTHLFVGGDILLLGGELVLSGCMFFSASFYMIKNVIGGRVAVFGGVLISTVTVMVKMDVFGMTNGVGHEYFVGGGVIVMDVNVYGLANIFHMFTGFGSFFVGGGVMVTNAVAYGHNYVALVGLGGALLSAVGSGVMIMNGAAYLIYCAPLFQAMVGGIIFLGSGVLNIVGSFGYAFGSTSTWMGDGNYAYNGAGLMILIGNPVYLYYAIWAFFGVGGIYALPAGLMIFIGNSGYIMTTCASLLGQGVLTFVGAGGGIFGGSFYSMFSVKECTYRPDWWDEEMQRVQKVFNFWVHGCGWTGEAGRFKVRPDNCRGQLTVSERFGGGGPQGAGSGGSGAYGRKALESDDEDEATGLTFYMGDMHLGEMIDKRLTPANWISDENLDRLIPPEDRVSKQAQVLIGDGVDCSMCGVTQGGEAAALEGSGARKCKRFKSCDDPGFKLPNNVARLTSGLTDEEASSGKKFPKIDPNSIVFSPTFISKAQVVLTCYGEGEQCGSEQVVASGIKASTSRTLQLSTVKVGLDRSMFAEEEQSYAESEVAHGGRRLQGDTCGGHRTVYNIFFVDTNLEDSQATKSLLSKEGIGAIAQALVNSKPDICAASIDSKDLQFLRVPANKSPELKVYTSSIMKSVFDQAGNPLVEVYLNSDPTISLGPSDPAVINSMYKIRLSDFPEGHRLKVDVRSAESETNGGLLVSLVRTSAYHTADGPLLVDWKPGHRLQDTLLFIRATDQNGDYTDSLTFNVEKVARRRLIGRERIMAFY